MESKCKTLYERKFRFHKLKLYFMLYILRHKANLSCNVHSFPSKGETDDEPR